MSSFRLADGGPDGEPHGVGFRDRLRGTGAGGHAEIAGQMMRGDAPFAGQDHGAFQHVPQFTHVAGPGVTRELFHNVRLHVHHARIVLAVQALDERFGERRKSPSRWRRDGRVI